MPSYNFEVAKAVLNETDKNRILCIYLSSNQTTINWPKATKDFGSASVESFKKMNVNMLKKIEKAGGLESCENMAPPLARAKKSRGRKRRMAEDCSDSDADKSPPDRPICKTARRSRIVHPETPESDNEDAMPIVEEAVSEGEVDAVELL